MGRSDAGGNEEAVKYDLKSEDRDVVRQQIRDEQRNAIGPLEAEALPPDFSLERPILPSAYVAGKLAEMERLASDASERHRAEMARRDAREAALRYSMSHGWFWAMTWFAMFVCAMIALAWSNAWRIVP